MRQRIEEGNRMVGMMCAFAERRLSAYADGELTGLERWLVERHLAKCPTCHEELSNLCSVGNLLQASIEPSMTTSPFLLNKVRANIAQELAEGRASEGPNKRDSWWIGELVAGASFILALPCLAAAFTRSAWLLPLAGLTLAAATYLQYSWESEQS